MMNDNNFEIFLVCIPGLEEILRAEAIENGFKKPKIEHGGITTKGGWKDVWRANLFLRGASRVLVRIGSFKVTHLAQLDKRAHHFPWGDFLRPDIPIRIDVSCKKSKIYHQKAAGERFERALTDTLGCPISCEAEICLKIRIVNDICIISIDTSGEGLHKRGHKRAVNKAPLRETLAALLLRQCGFKGNEPVIDPMCGSGTFILEAAEIATRQTAGRSRTFAFEKLATFDESLWHEMKDRDARKETEHLFCGFDRDAGAVEMATKNAETASLTPYCTFTKQPISHLERPDSNAGLIMINPPYGGRIGDINKLLPLYQTLGQKLADAFPGWRVGLLTNSDKLAKATNLPFVKEVTHFSHGGIKVGLYRTEPLA